MNEQNADLQAELEAARARIQMLERAAGAHESGHFYSPVPNAEDIANRLAEIEAHPVPEELPEIDLNLDRQRARLKLIGEVIDHNPPFPEDETPEFRYYYKNTQYAYNDGITLFGMLRSLRPKRIIEIGSGFSSALILDTNDRYFDKQLNCTFIEPYPDRLNALLRADDAAACTVYAQKVQDVDPAIFATLESGDILFVDSSHIVKYGSDLEYILRAVLPVLAAGVYIHFHDIFYPFEYPEAVVKLGHYWNECYMLRAFLANNDSYKIELFGDYFREFHLAELKAVSPLCVLNTGGNLWLQKVSRT